ncbi:mitochondrial carrier protein [Cryptococcus neoformans Tu401-1]|nr:mitochondrial carrier protein [Cryptococcus neoformans var. grubii Tu401-1]
MSKSSEQNVYILSTCKKDDIKSKMSSRPIIRFAHTPLSRGISISAPAFAPKKAAATTAKAKQGFAQKKKDTSSGSGGGNNNITLRYSMSGSPPDLSDLPRLNPEKFRKDNVGKPTIFSQDVQDKLKSFGLPSKIDKEFASAGGPASVVREATLDLVKRVEGAKAGSSKLARYILTGEQGSGKSVLLVQSVAYAIGSGWIVLYTPRASKWVNSTSQYIYDPETKTYAQWESAQNILSVLLETNKDKLSAIELPEKVELTKGKSVKAGESVAALAQLGAKDDRSAVKALESVVGALEKQTQFPVLWAMDEAQSLFNTSKYRAADYTPIEPYHLSTPRLALDFIAGRRSFSRGAVVTSLSLSDPSNLPSPALRSALSLSSSSPLTPYTPINPYHLAHAENLTPINVPYGMNSEEAAGLFELFAKKGWAPNGSDELFMESFMTSQGNPREMSKSLRKTFMPLTA